MIYTIEEKLQAEFTPDYLKAIQDLLGDWQKYHLAVSSGSITTTFTLKRSYTIGTEKRTEDVGWFSLSELPGNGNVVVSHGVQILRPFQGKGLNTMLCAARERASKAAGATMLLATVRNDNEAEKKVLVKCGWMPGAQTSEAQVWTKTL